MTDAADFFWDLAEVVTWVDDYLDDQVSQEYQDQPLAQDWARIAKVTEEAGEAIAELILYTGQNPRKQDQRPENADRIVDELADTALTAIYAIQHFTKDGNVTVSALLQKANFHRARLRSKAGQ